MDKKQISYTTVRILRYFAAAVFFVSISFVSIETSYYIAQRMTAEVSEDVIRVIHIILALFAYHSFFRAFVITDKAARAVFYNSKAKKVDYILKSAEVRFSLLITAVFFCLFTDAFAAKSIQELFGIPRIFSVLITAVAFFAIHILTFLECIFNYEKSEEKSRKEKRKIKDISVLVKSVIGSCLAYPILAYILPIFFPTLRTLPKVVFLICVVFIPIVILFFILFSAFDYVRAIFVRMRFLKKLKKAAHKNGYNISEISHPYSSLFADCKGKNFTVKANGKMYDCKLLSSLHYGDPMYFEEGGNGKVIRHITMRYRAPVAGPFARGGFIWQKLPDDIAQMHTNFKYSFEGDGKKVLIVCPTPHSIYATGYGQNRLLDVNDSVWGYTIMTGTAFINALERDTIK